MRYYCKTCIKVTTKSYRRTKIGLIKGIFSNQIWSSKYRWHNLPNYTKQELQEWILNQYNFNLLYNNWVKSWYKKDLIPSIDRLDDSIWYSIDNIQLITWISNYKKSHTDRKDWKIINQHKSVIWVNKKTWEIKKFYSIAEAWRKLWINKSNISSCCSGHKSHPHAWWYVWKYFLKNKLCLV